MVVGLVSRTGTVRFDHRDLGGLLGAAQHFFVAETFAVILGENEQHERVDAAVRVAEADADVVGVDEGDGGVVVADVQHLNDVVGRPADQEQADDHQHHLGGPPSPHRLLALDAADGSEDVVEGERVKGADDDERDDEAQDGLVERVPVHVLGPVQVHHADLHSLLLHHLGVEHDGDGEEEAAQPHQQVDDDGPLDGPPLRGGVHDRDVPRRQRLAQACEGVFCHVSPDVRVGMSTTRTAVRCGISLASLSLRFHVFLLGPTRLDLCRVWQTSKGLRQSLRATFKCQHFQNYFAISRVAP